MKLSRRLPRAAISVVSFVLVLPLLLVAFQNCSQFSVSDSISRLSASCTAKIQAQAPALAKLLGSKPPDCDSAKNYVCLIRKFSPETENSTTEAVKCLTTDTQTCIRVTEIAFDTKAARNSQYEARDFEAGGEYNRVEVQCSHALQYANAALFVGQGDDLDSAFVSAKSKCLASSASSSTAGME